MKRLIIVLLFFFSLNSFAQETTTYYFIRHAEKDRTDPNNANPKLTPKGHQRAVKWSEVFQEVSFDAVYSTDYSRTIETALPMPKVTGPIISAIPDTSSRTPLTY